MTIWAAMLAAIAAAGLSMVALATGDGDALTLAASAVLAVALTMREDVE